MYLTQIFLDPRSRRARRETAEPYQMHRSIMRAFPEKLPDDERVLFRLEQAPHSGVLKIIVQSIYHPEWSWLKGEQGQDYLLEMDEPNPAVKEFEPKFENGQRLIFRLKANPSVKRNGKRWGLQREEEQLEWLQRKADNGGFKLQGVRTGDKDFIQGALFRNEKKHKLRLLVVQFEGLLAVQDAQAFLETLQKGIGSGKGLGCGLLSVAKAK